MLVNDAGTLKLADFYCNLNSNIYSYDNVEEIYVNHNNSIRTLPMVNHLQLSCDGNTWAFPAKPNSNIFIPQNRWGNWKNDNQAITSWNTSNPINISNYGINSGLFFIGRNYTGINYNFANPIQNEITISLNVSIDSPYGNRAFFTLPGINLRVEINTGVRLMILSDGNIESSSGNQNIYFGVGSGSFAHLLFRARNVNGKCQADVCKNGLRERLSVTFDREMPEINRIFFNRKVFNAGNPFATLRFKSIRAWDTWLSDDQVAKLTKWEGF